LLVKQALTFVTGYNFGSAEEIDFHLEPTAAGPSSAWARTMARRFKCYVCVGYPEYTAASPSSPNPTVVRYNSAVMVSPQGNVIANYRKHHLYTTDETWAAPGGEGFLTAYEERLGRFAMGICMDLNPERFLAPFNKYEFANHVLTSGAELVVMPMAWLTTHPELLEEEAPVPDSETLAYWIKRLQPIVDVGGYNGKEIIFVGANRCGTENGAAYAGTSVVLGIRQGNVKVYGCLGRGVEDLLIADIAPSFTKPISRWR
jgi:protein N-terminal amidase